MLIDTKLFYFSSFVNINFSFVSAFSFLYYLACGRSFSFWSFRKISVLRRISQHLVQNPVCHQYRIIADMAGH